jgi:uncharacterized protein
MKHSKIAAILIAGLATAVSVAALARESAPAALPSAADYSTQVLPQTEGVVSWRTFAEIEFVPAPDGQSMVPKFGNAILSLDNKEVQVAGFMLPLGLGRGQKRFLLSSVPADCSFCMPAGAEGVVEVLTEKATPYATEPLVVKGKLAVLKNDPRGVLYQLNDATSIAAPPAKR